MSSSIPQPDSSAPSARSNEAVGQRLAQLRIKHSLNQAQMADKLGVSTTGYQNYERGSRELPSKLLVKFHDMFEADPLWILTGVDASATQWTPEALKAIKDAVWILDTAAKQSRVDLESELKARLVARLVQYGITDTDAVNELLSLRK